MPVLSAQAIHIGANTEALVHLQQMTRMQQALTLTNDELAALTEGADLLQALVDKLEDVPTRRADTVWKTAPDAPRDHRTNHRALARAAPSPTR